MNHATSNSLFQTETLARRGTESVLIPTRKIPQGNKVSYLSELLRTNAWADPIGWSSGCKGRQKDRR